MRILWRTDFCSEHNSSFQHLSFDLHEHSETMEIIESSAGRDEYKTDLVPDVKYGWSDALKPLNKMQMCFHKVIF